MKSMSLLASLVLVATSGGCAAWTVKSETAANTPLSQYHTYEWVRPPDVSDDPLVDQRVRDEVTAQLADKGMVPAAAGQAPDFLVGYRLQTRPRRQVVYNGVDYAAPGASGATVIPPLPVTSTYTYQDQALILDFVDARSGRVFWRGYASYVVDQPAEVSTAKTQQAAARILRKYPATEVARASRPTG